MSRISRFLVFFLFLAAPPLRAGLINPGDLAFIGFNADGTDDFALVLLADADAGTLVRFNDNEWQGSNFNTGEGAVTWTISQALTAGTVVTFSSITSTANVGFGPSVGTMSGAMQLAVGGETIYAFLGTNASTPTTFLAAISNNAADYGSGKLGGTGLAQGSTAVLLPSATRGGQYSGNRTGSSEFEDYISLVGNTAANWTTSTTNGQATLPFNTTAFQTTTVATPEPGTLALGGIAGAMALLMRKWRRRK